MDELWLCANTVIVVPSFCVVQGIYNILAMIFKPFKGELHQRRVHTYHMYRHVAAE